MSVWIAGGGVVRVKYFVINNLTRASNSNNSTYVIAKRGYTANLSYDSDCIYYDTLSITMGGEDITSLAYSDGVINIPTVSGDIVINAVGHVPNIYAINKELVGVTLSNGDSTATERESYYTTVSLANGYTTISNVVVTMGGVDITSTAYSNGAISIPNVTGDIAITVIAVDYIMLSITGSGSLLGSVGASVGIGGTTYTSASSIQVVPNSTVLDLYVKATSNYAADITINGSVVATAKKGRNNSATYRWTIPSNASSVQIALSAGLTKNSLTVTWG